MSKIRPPTHSANGPVSANADPGLSEFKRSEESGLPERATYGGEAARVPPDPAAISANEGDSQNMTLPPLEALQARQAMNAPNRLGLPAALQMNEAERALLEFNESKAALRAEYGRLRLNSGAVQERYDRACENMVRLGLMKG